MPEAEPAPLRASIDAAVTVLSQAGVPSPRVDAELLAAHLLGVARGRLPLIGSLSSEQYRGFVALVRARASRVPLQHLTGRAPFGDLELAVGPGVFVPRFETELLVRWGLSAVQRQDPLIVDLCSGSGAIALAVATALPRSSVYAVERSPGALPWLRRNVAAIAQRVRVVAGDVTDPAVLSEVDGTVDLVLCNPPYVPEGASVDMEVSAHDPHDAVFGGADGLALIPAIVHRAAALLHPGGWLGIEHDDSHGHAVPEIMRRGGVFTDVSDHTDLAGRPRFATARRLAD